MRFFHLADLHLGKRLGECSLYEDQKYILGQILELTDRYAPQALLIAGDVYDKSAPAAEAVALFDDFLTELAKRKRIVLLISGNHDSPERLNFGGRIMARQNIYLCGLFNGQAEQIVLEDCHGKIIFHLLPFIRPAQARRFYPEETIDSYEDALRLILAARPPDRSCRNVLMAHQFITSGACRPERSDSEQINLGTLDNIDASAFAGFDYVALGHMHRPQSIGGQHIRYAGSPLKYSFSEARHQKSLTMVELGEKGVVNIETLALRPLRDLRQIKGPLAKLLDPAVYEQANREDYLHVTLTDEDDLIAPLDALRQIYPNVLRLDFANSRAAITQAESAASTLQHKTPAELFADFYRLQQNIELPDDKQALVEEIFRELGGDA
ncbi:MAG: exonuclease SbcCD subunit D [Clostridia bacterium]|nr:exonuclease SbcCD subunit D [Clostridia bacterium]